MNSRRFFDNYDSLADQLKLEEGGGAGLRKLYDLKGIERADAIETLRIHLLQRRRPDWAVDALVAMDPDRAEALLVDLMTGADMLAVSAARVSWARNRPPAVIDCLKRTLRFSADSTTRLRAADLLCETGTPDASDITIHLENEVDLRVVQLFFTHLLGMLQIKGLQFVYSSPVSRIRALLMNPLQAVRRVGITELKYIAAGISKGQSFESLGILPARGLESVELRKFRNSVVRDTDRRWVSSVDLISFRSLKGEERLRGIQLMYALLARQDGRSGRIFAALDLPETLPALREAARQGSQDFVDGVRDAMAVVSLCTEAERGHQEPV
ncbi:MULTISPECIES: hypothetical protein [Streptomyces]|uniref:hypothetical protein n=1 Tax=Streptomyces TaxID=1883 RepID=UPI00131B93EF|nr:hypothetical protein [Streptomyces virginiae]